MDRVIGYVDGFNLYHGLRQSRWRKYYWLDLKKLLENLLLPGQSLECVKYFTTRVRSTRRDPHKSKRQNTFLEALATLPDLEIHYGHFVEKPAYCPKCREWHPLLNEKMSDVNLAVALVADAYEDRFDTALLISGDSDLVNAVRAVRRLKGKRVIVWFPPKRHSKELESAASAACFIGRDKIARSQLPARIQKPDGHVLRRPERWRARKK